MAIYTEIKKTDATKIVEEFALGDLVSSSGIKNGSVNTHYLLETKRGRFFAKIDEVKSELEVKQELDLLFHLRKQGFPCLQPLKTKTGRYYIEFRGKCLTVSRHLDGIELPIESLTGSHLGILGHTLANLHLIGRSYKKGIDNRFGFSRIVAIYREVRRQLPSHLRNIVRVLDDEFSYLENYLDNNLPKGIIHGDFTPRERISELRQIITTEIDFGLTRKETIRASEHHFQKVFDFVKPDDFQIDSIFH